MSAEDEAEAEGPRGERIAKFLARAGVASRRDAEKLIAEGLVRLGGKLVTSPATFVSPGDAIIVNGKPVAAKARIVLQPGDVITYETPGGGGMGPPSERDPAAIARDIKEGYVTP